MSERWWFMLGLTVGAIWGGLGGFIRCEVFAMIVGAVGLALTLAYGLGMKNGGYQ